ncbi:MAG: thiamine phosphate synthase, partial [Candidatus Sumerlaeota bacterium]|nr:thiamine phosphate synthase [Candidatus Sumerlaeota bacterium]
PRLALDAGADGFHGGQGDITPEDAHRILGAGAIIGLSTHTREQVLASRKRPVDYIGFGPIFPTATKATEVGPLGAEELEWALSHSAVPVIPIGGITRDNLPALIAVGARHAAVVSAVVAASDVAAAARELVALLH